LSPNKIPFSFDGKNLNAQKAAARRAANLVTGVTKQTKAAIRAVIVRAFSDGISPYDAARLVRSMVGLTKQQALAAYAFRVELINSGLPIARVNRRVDAYAKKALKRRALTISRTEIVGSLAEGQEAAWTQAQSQGYLLSTAKKEWMTTPIDACKICIPLDGQQVLLTQPFHSIIGPLMRPTAHPNCRCVLAPA